MKKGNRNALRPGADTPSTVLFTMRITPGERTKLNELAQALKMDVSQLVRSALSDYRMRAIASGLKLKK